MLILNSCCQYQYLQLLAGIGLALGWKISSTNTGEVSSQTNCLGCY